MSQKPLVGLRPTDHRRLKMAAAVLDMPLNHLVDEAVCDWFEKNRERIEAAKKEFFANEETQAVGTEP